ncbi:MAG: 3-deoxy-manno-octulosonate cytidylyltransferase [Alphaproteobacteria bacterium]|nr:3-deoxy-manno-octulosonate cytidylyltransferase [Alphaproteobacteria bacterium]MCD8570215.1 3-deoxy-manno-octulosonate cytidylyltransferase [Alphaproteobacteria bacterium]
MKTAIIIPARYASTRFPGKPLAMLAGKTMLARVVELARKAAADFPGTGVYVTTDDERIKNHAGEIGVECLMTSPDCPTGSDRVLAAAKQLPDAPDFLLNLQGDAPFTPVTALQALLDAYLENPDVEVVTAVHRLSWADLDRLRENKKTTPFSGTTATVTHDGKALWFSKNIIPAMRKESELRAAHPLSPVYQHFGLYGYRYGALEKFCALPQGPYETLEGLEQLRFLENGISIRAVSIDIADGPLHSGIDTPEDLARAEALLKA